MEEPDVTQVMPAAEPEPVGSEPPALLGSGGELARCSGTHPRIGMVDEHFGRDVAVRVVERLAALPGRGA